MLVAPGRLFTHICEVVYMSLIPCPITQISPPIKNAKHISLNRGESGDLLSAKLL